MPPSHSDLFVSGTEGYHTFRIPALVVSDKGTLLAFAEGRKNTAGDNGDLDMLLRRSFDGGATWQPIQLIWDDGPNTCGNPCAVVDRATGRICLLMTHNLGDDYEPRIIAGEAQSTRTVWITHSDDDGETWSKPIDITRTTKDPDWRWYATGPGVGIQLTGGPHKGRLIIPCDHTYHDERLLPAADGQTYGWASHVIYSDDHSETWQLGGSVRPLANECQLVELADGRLMLNIRSADKSIKRRAVSFSDDGGVTWSRLFYDDALIDPICQASIITCEPADGQGEGCLLFSNLASTDDRCCMTVRMSRDEGKTWPVSKVLHDGPAAYSSLAVLPDMSIACFYEAGRQDPYEKITFARFTLKWLTDG